MEDGNIDDIWPRRRSDGCRPNWKSCFHFCPRKFLKLMNTPRFVSIYKLKCDFLRVSKKRSHSAKILVVEINLNYFFSVSWILQRTPKSEEAAFVSWSSLTFDKICTKYWQTYRSRARVCLNVKTWYFLFSSTTHAPENHDMPPDIFLIRITLSLLFKVAKSVWHVFFSLPTFL